MIKQTMIACSIAAAVLCVSCETAREASAVESAPAAAPAVEISYKAGQLVSIAAPKVRDGGEAAVKDYFARALPLAGRYGLSRDGVFKIERKLVGDYEPDAIAFFSWPNAESEAAFSAEPAWREIKALRPAGWEELKTYTAPVERDVTLRFDKSKVYTLAIAWLAADHPDDYARYMKNIEPELAAVGGRFVYSMFAPAFEAHASASVAPGRLTIVEWPTLESLAALRARPGYQRHYPLFSSGVSQFEFYEISPLVR